MSPKRLSVVMTATDGGAMLDRCLASLLEGNENLDFEIVVPIDSTVLPPSLDFQSHGVVRLVPLELPARTGEWHGPAAQHELYDRRRAAGLRAAKGDVVAMIEDRVIPMPGWPQAILRLHQTLPHAVIGGAIACNLRRPLAFALYLSDYGRYQPPFHAGPRTYVSDVNLSYKREPVFQLRHLWSERYHETTVHWALLANGETLYLTPEIEVRYDRQDLRWDTVLRERFAWGRLFAVTRAREMPARRWLYAIAAPLLPVILYFRLLRQQLSRQNFGRFILATPALLVLLVSWSVGELVGYLMGTG